MFDPGYSYGEPVYGAQLEPVLDRVEEHCIDYLTSSLNAGDIFRKDFGVDLYWDRNSMERFVLVTVYNEDRVYLSAGASNSFNQEEIIEIGFVGLEKLGPHLEAAGSTAESLDREILE